MTILVTGARGRIGQAIIARLHSAGLDVRAASNKPADLTVPTGVETVELGLSRPETFEAALRGVRQVFLYPEPAGIHDLVKAAGAAGVEHIVLLSSSTVLADGAETDPLASHSLQVERALAGSEITTTILRPDAFATNALAWSHFLSRGLPIRLPYPEAQIAPIHPEDIADIAIEAFTGDSLTGRAVTLTGPESLSFAEQLAIIAELLGHDFPVEKITRSEAETDMARYMPAPMFTSLLDLWAAATHGPAPIADTTETLLGKPARDFRQWTRENLAAFRP